MGSLLRSDLQLLQGAIGPLRGLALRGCPVFLLQTLQLLPGLLRGLHAVVVLPVSDGEIILHLLLNDLLRPLVRFDVHLRIADKLVPQLRNDRLGKVHGMDTHNGHGLGGHLHVRVDVDYQPPVRPGQLLRQVFRDIVESAEVRPLSLHLYMDGLFSFGRPFRRSLRHIDHVPLILLPHGVHLRRGLAGGQQQQQRNNENE